MSWPCRFRRCIAEHLQTYPLALPGSPDSINRLLKDFKTLGRSFVPTKLKTNMNEVIQTTEPIIVLSNWSVYDVPVRGLSGDWTRHLVGFAEDLDLPQVSSAIGEFDAEGGIGSAASGRTFRLVGPAGRHPKSDGMWVRWKRLHQVHQERDVTNSVSKQMVLFQGGTTP